jgi:translation initiation factor 3 subunit D
MASSVSRKPLFKVPDIHNNATGWGPCAIPTQFKDTPYQPFSKADRLGKVSDWSGALYQDRRQVNKYMSQVGAGGSMYNYVHDEDESTYTLVDTTRVHRSAYQKNRARIAQNRANRQSKERREKGVMVPLSKAQKNRERDRMRQQRKWQKQYRGRFQQQRPRNPVKPRNASVEVRPEWEILEEMDFVRLSKLWMEAPSPVDLKQCGTMGYYDKIYDRATTKSEVLLSGVNRVFHKVTTSDDPVIPQLTREFKDSSKQIVYATDAILAALMTCTRSVYSWDVVAQRIGQKILILDKRDKSQFDLLTVNETAGEPPQDEGASMNSPANLALEATFINQNFSQQVLKKGAWHEFPERNPFVEEDNREVASVGYRYRKWQLSEDTILVARCEHDAIMQSPDGSEVFMNIKAFNEWDPQTGAEWRQKLDSQRGAVLATELKNNSTKLAKWTISSILAGSQLMKLGYASQ